MFKRYSDRQIQILTTVGKYTYAGYSQFKRLGIATHTSNLSTMVSDLTQCSKPLLKEVPHRPQYEKKFYLTKQGRDTLMELMDEPEREIKFPKFKLKKDTSSEHEKHRSQTINFQIEMDLACADQNIGVLFCHRYFDVTGNTRDKNLASKTAIIFEGNKTLKADMVFMLGLENGTKEFYTHEHENGNDSGKTVDKMVQYAKCILGDHAQAKYGFQNGYRTLWVFGQEGTMNAVLKRMEDNGYFANIKEWFLLKAESEIGTDFFGGWRNLDGELRKLYYL